MPTSDFDIDAALEEVQEKTIEAIEEETAIKWASRSLACFQLYKETGLIEWRIKAEDFGNEALEHAAMCRDKGKTLKIIEDKLDKCRKEIDDSKDEHVEKSAFQLRQQKLAKLFK